MRGPGTTIGLPDDVTAAAPRSAEGSPAGIARRLVGRALRDPVSAVGFLLAFGFLIVVAGAPVIAPNASSVVDLSQRLQAPSSDHWFGTDQSGRDIFSRVVYGARISLVAGVTIVGLGVLIGTPLGLLAGWAGGWLDDLLMRVTDMFLAFPALVLAMGIAAALGPSLTNATIATALTWWPWFARLVRGETLRLKQEGFVEAAKVAGATNGRIVLQHILPNSIPTLIVQMSLLLGYAVLTLAGLSFIGLGAQPPTPEWGAMVASGRDYYLSQWWIVTFPGLAILLAVMAANLVGETLRQALSPRQRGQVN